jgi:splicing factor U2AF subunit
MYQNPPDSQIAAAGGDPSQLDPKKVEKEFDDFYAEVFDELAR